jgi:NAD(P)-dependent dehydrogenase (short-subunit alcohol dehydrogenase family)
MAMQAAGVALVTGASRGIGRATALELSRRGFDVVASMRNPEDGNSLREDALGFGGKLRVSRIDVDDPESIEIPDGLRVLVNNAGIEGENEPVEHATMSDWRRIFETNVFGLIEVTRRAIPKLRATPGAVLCNITSCSILVPMPFFSIYRASKAAVMAMGESLRTELRPFGVRVVEIMPGAIETDMLASSKMLPEAARHAPYRPMAEKVATSRELGQALTTPTAVAAGAIADAILDDDGPLRYACDPMGSGLLTSWRGQSDEETMNPMVELFS